MTISKSLKIFLILILLLFLISSLNVNAFIRREYTLKEVVHACNNVMFGKVSSINQERMYFIVDEIENIKGEDQFKQIKINFLIGQGDSPQRLMDKIHTDAPVVIFYIPQGPKRLEALGYVSDIWLRLFAIHDNPKDFEWHFTHIEKYMNRTFDGDCLKMQSSIRDILGKKASHSSRNRNVSMLHSMLKNLVHFFMKFL